MDAGKKNRVLQTSVFVITLAVLLGLLVFSVLAAIAFGNADISLKEVYSVILYEIFHPKCFSEFAQGAIHDVVWLIRLPRVLLALAVGMGLSVCGVVMQAVVKNPLADPYVLGISSGASLGATMAIVLGLGTLFGDNFVGVMAFVGALLTSFAVMFIANVGGRANAGKLILAGMAISTVCSSFSNFILYTDPDKSSTQEVVQWTMGNLGNTKWSEIHVILPIIIIGTLIFWTQFRNLNLMLLGDETAVTLGTDLHRVRTLYLILASVMMGFSVYASGMIGFVGLVIPHVIRMIFGTDHKKLIPLAALTGAVFLIWADVACRSILPHSELPVGILTSMIGGPCFIYLMVRRSYGFGGAK